jgi:hypothetical protein
VVLGRVEAGFDTQHMQYDAAATLL